MLQPVLIPNEICQILIPWLKTHEDDIAHGINDFGDLLPVYEALFNEAPQPVNAVDAQKPCDYCSDAEKMGHHYCPKCGLFWGTHD